MTESFWKLRETPLHELGGAEWDGYYEKMAPFLRHADPEIRSCTVERLAMAVLWAERQPAEQARYRLDWLLEHLELAHQNHPRYPARFPGRVAIQRR